MNAIAYDAERHYGPIIDWLAGHGLAPIPLAMFPPTGYVVEGLAAVFVYHTQSTVAFIETLVSNPGADKRDANRALDAAVRAALRECEDAGCEAVIATTSLPAVARRARKHGFRSEPTRLLIRRLPNGRRS